MSFALGVVPVVLLLLGFPIFLVMLTAVTVALVWFMNVPLAALHQNLFGSVNAYALLAIPYFIYAGELMGRGSVAQRLVDFVQGGVGSARGSLGVTTVGTATIFGAISGVSAAAVATIGKVMYPAMVKAGYPKPFSAGLITAVGAIDIIIPPSIPMIVYGAAAQESVPRLYAAGILPGLLIAALIAGYVIWRAWHGNFGAGEPFNFQRFGRSTVRGIWALGAPVIILGGIYGGVFSPTEAAAVACVYAVFVTRFVFRELTISEIVDAAAATVRFTAQILIIVACAGVFSWLLTVNQVPATLVAWIQHSERRRLVVPSGRQRAAAGGRLFPRSAFGDPAADAAADPRRQGAGYRHRSFRHRGDGQSRHRVVSSAVRDKYFRRAVGARHRSEDTLSRDHAVRVPLSDCARTDHLRPGDFSGRGAPDRGMTQCLELRLAA